MTPLDRRRVFVLSLLACLAHGQSARAQEAPHIAIGEKYEVGEKIVAEFIGSSVQGYAGAVSELKWEASEGVEVEQLDRKLFIWAKAGEYEVEVSETCKIQVFAPDPEFPTDPTKAKPTTLTLGPFLHTEAFVVGTPKPDPIPDPDPVPTGLAALVPDPAHRSLVAQFYADLAAAVRSGAATTTTHFRNGYRKAIADGKASGLLPAGLSAIDKPISDRIAGVIGVADGVPLDAAKQAALAACLQAVSVEFGGAKWP